MARDNRSLWADWVAREIGGDTMRQRTALDAVMQALAVGRSSAEAAQAARASVASLPGPGSHIPAGRGPAVSVLRLGPSRPADHL